LETEFTEAQKNKYMGALTVLTNARAEADRAMAEADEVRTRYTLMQNTLHEEVNTKVAKATAEHATELAREKVKTKTAQDNEDKANTRIREVEVELKAAEGALEKTKTEMEDTKAEITRIRVDIETFTLRIIRYIREDLSLPEKIMAAFEKFALPSLMDSSRHIGSFQERARASLEQAQKKKREQDSLEQAQKKKTKKEEEEEEEERKRKKKK
jgi:hypothetical protein